MAMVWGGSRSAWDFGNPENWVINKSLEQNWREFSTGVQIMGLAIPSATIGKYPGATLPSSVAGVTSGAGAVSATGAGLTGAGLAGGATGLIKPILDVTEKGLDLAILEQLFAWLTKYWWIPTIFIGLWTVGKFGGK